MTDLIHDLENADAETCFEAVRQFVDEEGRVYQWWLYSVINEAKNRKCPALLLGVVAALVPEGFGRSSEMENYAGCFAYGFVWSAGRKWTGRSAHGIEACALAAAILKARETSDG